MICTYNGFKECDWENCAARMYVDNPCRAGYQMKVCAIAYNGGNVQNRQMFALPAQPVQQQPMEGPLFR